MKKFLEIQENTQWMQLILKRKTNINKRTAEIKQKCIFFYIYKGIFEVNYANDERYCKVKDHCQYTGEYRGAPHSIYNLRYSVPKEIPIVFRNGSNYNYHFIIKKIAEKFKTKLFIQEKILKRHNFFHFQQKKKLQELIKMEIKSKNPFNTD